MTSERMSDKYKRPHKMNLKLSNYLAPGGEVFCFCGLKAIAGAGWPDTHCPREDETPTNHGNASFGPSRYVEIDRDELAKLRADITAIHETLAALTAPADGKEPK